MQEQSKTHRIILSTNCQLNGKTINVLSLLELTLKLCRFYINKDTVSREIKQYGIAIKYLRKLFHNFLIMNNVPESVADFIEGRAPESVGSMHYLGKVKQADYWYGLVQKELRKI
jgi:intergrase/recombinase